MFVIVLPINMTQHVAVSVPGSASMICVPVRYDVIWASPPEMFQNRFVNHLRGGPPQVNQPMPSGGIVWRVGVRVRRYPKTWKGRGLSSLPTGREVARP